MLEWVVGGAFAYPDHNKKALISIFSGNSKYKDLRDTIQGFCPSTRFLSLRKKFSAQEAAYEKNFVNTIHSMAGSWLNFYLGMVNLM